MRRGLAVAFCAVFLFSGPVHSQDTGLIVLKSSDVDTYRAIFAAQAAGQLAKADALIDDLTDKSLLGYVLQQRYLGPKYVTKYSELEGWMTKYADHIGADRVHRLALRKKPKAAKGPASAAPAKWRGERFDSEGTAPVDLDSTRAERILEQMRGFSRESRPERAEALLAPLRPGAGLSQEDIDRLGAFVAAAYLAEGRDKEALRAAGSLIARSASTAPQAHWAAGLASYRLARFAEAAGHFEAASMSGNAARMNAGGAFWAARALMRAGQPERVVSLYARAADEPTTFYGMLALRLLGKDAGLSFQEPHFDQQVFKLMMETPSARRAVALWQVGRKDLVERELTRALGEIPEPLDPAFSGLARALDAPSVELRAAELSAHRGVYLTSLYPVPSYAPANGFQLDRAMLLAFARQESRFDVDAESRAGARGLMQLMPGTAVAVAGDRSLARSNSVKLDDPSYSMSLGQDHLRDLLDRQNGNLLGLAAAYNAGAGNLSRWMEMQEGNNDPLLFIESIPAPETRDYIKRVMMNLWMYRMRLGEPVDGLDETAAGTWPTYRQASTPAPAQ
jgi:soluble lytic murein transglycosylase-like protein